MRTAAFDLSPPGVACSRGARSEGRIPPAPAGGSSLGSLHRQEGRLGRGPGGGGKGIPAQSAICLPCGPQGFLCALSEPACGRGARSEGRVPPAPAGGSFLLPTQAGRKAGARARRRGERHAGTVRGLPALRASRLPVRAFWTSMRSGSPLRRAGSACSSRRELPASHTGRKEGWGAGQAEGGKACRHSPRPACPAGLKASCARSRGQRAPQT